MSTSSEGNAKLSKTPTTMCVYILRYIFTTLPTFFSGRDVPLHVNHSTYHSPPSFCRFRDTTNVNAQLLPDCAQLHPRHPSHAPIYDVLVTPKPNAVLEEPTQVLFEDLMTDSALLVLAKD